MMPCPWSSHIIIHHTVPHHLISIHALKLQLQFLSGESITSQLVMPKSLHTCNFLFLMKNITHNPRMDSLSIQIHQLTCFDVITVYPNHPWTSTITSPLIVSQLDLKNLAPNPSIPGGHSLLISTNQYLLFS